MRRASLLSALAVLALAGALQAQTGTITGTVTDRDSGQPLGGARVQVIATTLATVTDARGTYTLRDVSPGTREVRVVMLGYASQAQTVRVESGQRLTLNWSLVAVPFSLDELVTTATGEQMSRQLGNAVSKVDVANLVPTAPVNNLSDVLGGRVAGVTVLQSSGAPGSATRIRIRGISSASLANDPLVYVDGIRVNERGVPLTLGNGGESPSFFDDINPEEIENIEVIKGPSAATLYGTQAANGVLRITTKRGKAGPARMTFYGEFGVVNDVTHYRPVYYAKAQGSDESCFSFQQAEGTCQVDKLYVRDLSKEADYDWVRTGFRQQYGMQVTGGNNFANYFLSAEFEDLAGTQTLPPRERRFLSDSLLITDPRPAQLDPADLRRVNLRANVSAAIGSQADVQVSVGYVNSENTIAQAGDNLAAIVGFFVDASADPRRADFPWSFGRPAYAFMTTITRSSDHFINGLNAKYTPLPWLNLRGTVGADLVNFQDEALAKNGESAPYYGYPLGFRTYNRLKTAKYSVDLGATASFGISRRFTSRTSLGAQYNKDRTTGTYNTGRDLPPGGVTFTGASSKESSEQTTEYRTLGTYLEQQFGLDDRLYVTGAVRIDQNSAFGAENQAATYPKVSASWMALEGPTERYGINQLRLRAAYGQSGQQPGALSALTYFSPTVVATRSAAPQSAVILGGLGSTTLKPERSAEIELGFDLTAWKNRVTLEATAYRKRTTDAIVVRPLPPSAGATASRAENVGEVLNEGVELSVLARPVEGQAFSWDLGLEAAFNRNRLEDLGGVAPLINLYTQSVVGQPLFSPRGRRIESFRDANGDGIIVPSEIVLSDTAVGLGSSVPTRTLSLSSSFNLLRGRLRVLTLFDYKGGFVATDGINAFQCWADQNCLGLHDPSASLEEQARAVAALNDGTNTGWTEDGDFVRWRELAVTYDLPASWARALRMASASITLSGRNLALWTGYTGYDPELASYATVGASGDAFGSVNAWSLAQPRTVVLRINLGVQTGSR